MTFAVAVLVGLSSYLAIRGLAQRSERSRAAVLALAPAVQRSVTPERPWTERLGRTRAARILGGTERLARRLTLAGSPRSLDAAVGLRAIGLVGVVSVFAILVPALPGALALLPPAFLVAVRMPEISLARTAKRRQAMIGAKVPDLVEVLVTTTKAGLNAAVALRRSADVLGGPLGEEVEAAVREMDLGVPWRSALDHLGERTAVPSLRRLTTALSRSQRLGTSVDATLRTVADDLRAERRVHAEELARRAPVKMLFPLVFLILPAFLLLTVGPVVLATIHSFH